MIKAKEMFYKLGYEECFYEAIPKLVNRTKLSDNTMKFKCEDYSITIIYEKKDNKDIRISFIKNNDGIFFDKSEDGNAIPINIGESKAVIEQCKELGWED